MNAPVPFSDSMLIGELLRTPPICSKSIESQAERQKEKQTKQARQAQSCFSHILLVKDFEAMTDCHEAGLLSYSSPTGGTSSMQWSQLLQHTTAPGEAKDKNPQQYRSPMGSFGITRGGLALTDPPTSLYHPHVLYKKDLRASF